MTTGRVGAVIVNYNAGDDLINCVASLRDQGVQDIEVSDNGSSDDSLDKLASRFPDVKVSHLPNPGYGGGMNHGAARLENEVVFIMNPDAALLPNAVEKLLARLDSDPKIGLIGPRTENPDGSLYPSVRRFPNLVDGIGHAVLGMFWPTNPFSRRYKMLDWHHDTFRVVDWVSGASMFARREAFESVGGFDDDFWMYLEDTDLCLRLQQAGWKVVYDPEARIVHIGGTATTKSKRPYRFLAAHHNSVLRYQRKHATGINRVLYPVILLGIKARLGVAWLPVSYTHLWRVEALVPDTLLRLRAEMRLPGRAWLEWSIEDKDDERQLTQRARYQPRGIAGRLYWYSLLPFHAIIFKGLARALVKEAEEGKAESVQPVRS